METAGTQLDDAASLSSGNFPKQHKTPRRWIKLILVPFLTIVLIAGITIAHKPPPAYAGTLPIWSSLSHDVRVTLKLCVVNAVAMAAVSGISGVGLLALGSRAGIIVRSIASAAGILSVAERLAAVEQIGFAAALSRTMPSILGTIGPACVGAPLGFWLKDYFEKNTTPDGVSEDPQAASAATVDNPSLLCQYTPGATLSDSGICTTPDGQSFAPGNVPFGPDCSGVPGTYPDQNYPSGYCEHDPDPNQGEVNPKFYDPTGNLVGTCAIGSPIFDQRCFDGRNFYDPNGNIIGTQTAGLPDDCISYLANQGSTLDGCTGAVANQVLPPDTPTPASNPYAGDWHGSFGGYILSNFILSVSSDGSRGTFLLVSPQTTVAPDWNNFNYTVVGTWYASLSFTDTTVTGTFDSNTQNLCGGTGFNFIPHSFTLTLANPSPQYSGTVSEDAFSISGDGTSCPSSSPTTDYMGISRP